jgi:hypothetical protein
MRALPLLLLAACTHIPGQPKPGDLSLTVTSPTAGDEILASEHPTITVTGTVATTDPAYGVLVAYVNGASVDLDSTGVFTAEVTPTVGVNHIAVDAGDGFGTVVTQAMDVMWAPEYLPTKSSTTAFDVNDALDLYLGQSFFDARRLGTTLDLTTDPVVAHDLASALELILWNIDLASLLSGGIHLTSSSASLDINIPSAKPAEIVVDASVIDTPVKGIDLDIDLNGVYLTTTGTFSYNNRTLTVAGGITADMHASARIDLAINPDGTIAVLVENVTSVVGPLVPNFTGPDGNELDGLILVGNNDFRQFVEGMIQQTLIPTFTNKIPPLLEALLGATDQLLNNQMFTLDTSLGTPVTLSLNGMIAGLDVAAGPAIGVTPGHVTVRQQVSISTPNTPIHPMSRGAARAASPAMFPPSNTSALTLMLSQDFLNTMLHSLWNSGLLEGNASFGGLTAQVSAKLQPFARQTPDESSCTIDGVRCDLIVELGQVEVTLPDFEQTFAINAQAGARVVVNGNTVSLTIQQTPTLVVWETSAVPGRLTPDAIKDVVANVVWPQLFGAIADKLHITLPIPDLAALGLDQLSPNLANAQLQLDVHQRASVVTGYLGLGADLELSTPHP